MPIRTGPGEIGHRDPTSAGQIVLVLNTIIVVGNGVEAELELSLGHDRGEDLRKLVAGESESCAGGHGTKLIGHNHGIISSIRGRSPEGQDGIGGARQISSVPLPLISKRRGVKDTNAYGKGHERARTGQLVGRRHNIIVVGSGCRG